MSKSSASGGSDPAAVLLLPPVCADNGVSRTRAQQRISLTTKRRKMSRRANLIGICGVSSLCILLLIATAQHRPAPLTMGSGMGVAVGSSGLASGYSGGERRHAGAGLGAGGGAAAAGAGAGSSDALPLQAAIGYNMSASIADVLAAQRARIDTEMENFEYPQGRFGVDAEKLSDLTPATGGVPVRSVVITTWRSGSTFLGDILNAMPGTYYHYEPLLTLGINRVRDADEGAMALRHLKSLLNCDYSDMGEYLEYAKTHAYLFSHNERLWRVCKDFPHYCYQSKLVTPFCKLFPMQSMKTVRVQLSIAKELLDDKSWRSLVSRCIAPLRNSSRRVALSCVRVANSMSKSSASGASDPAAVLLLPPVCADNGVSRTRAQQRISLITKRRKMSRRANLIGICGVSSLCILLLIATAQHRPAPLTMGSGMGVAVGSSGLASGYSGGERRHAGAGLGAGGGAAAADVGAGSSDALPLQAAIGYNMSASIADVLAAQRARIDTEMENFEYPQGRFGVDAEKLSDLTPATGGVPVRSVVITTWRSGSTFLGDILNAMPGTYYYYEPLLTLGINRVRDANEGAMALRHLKSLLNCDYSDLGEYLEYAKTHAYLFSRKERLWRLCKDFPHYCYQSKLATPFCKLFPMQSMKTVRVQLSIAKELLDDKSLNVRMVLLVRDPRGTMQSRKHRDWCAGNPDCDDPSHLCNDLVADYQTAVQLLKEYPSRFRTLRYEDLSLNINDMTQEILQFFGLPFDPLVEEFLDTHTKVNIGGVSSTYRDSRWAPFHWKQDLRPDEIVLIQKHCTEAMKLWGYRQIANFTDYQHTFDPMEQPPPLV